MIATDARMMAAMIFLNTRSSMSLPSQAPSTTPASIQGNMRSKYRHCVCRLKRKTAKTSAITSIGSRIPVEVLLPNTQASAVTVSMEIELIPALEMPSITAERTANAHCHLSSWYSRSVCKRLSANILRAKSG